MMSWVWQVLEESFALPIWNWGYKGHCMKKSLRCGLIFFRVSRTELLVKTAPTRYQEYPTWCRIFVLKDAPKSIHPKTIKIAISPVADSGLLRDCCLFTVAVVLIRLPRGEGFLIVSLPWMLQQYLFHFSPGRGGSLFPIPSNVSLFHCLCH